VSATRGVYVTLEELIALRYKARGFSFLPRQPVRSLLAGRHASRMRGRGLNFEEIRAYLPGDDIRSIDWRVTARTRKPHTRVFTEERDRPALLLVDQRVSMFFGTQVAMKSVTAAQVAALAAWRVVDSGDRVGALVFNDTEIVEVKPQRSRRTVMHILEEIVRMNGALHAGGGIPDEPGMLNRVLHSAERMAGHDFAVFVLSDFWGVDDDTQKHITRIARHNDLVCALVHDPSAMKLPATGRLVVSDGELQMELDLAEGRTHRALEAYSNDRLQRALRWTNELGVPVVPVNNVDDPVEQIRRLLGG
jgi:uncharacterized protein (DUF58 family)